MSLSFIIAKLFGKYVPLIKSGVNRFVMFLSIILPVKLAFQYLYGIVLHVIEIVQNVYPFLGPSVSAVGPEIHAGKRFEFSLAELPMYTFYVLPIHMSLRPGTGKVTLSSLVETSNDVFNTDSLCHLVHQSENRMITWDFGIRGGSF